MYEHESSLSQLGTTLDIIFSQVSIILMQCNSNTDI